MSGTREQTTQMLVRVIAGDRNAAEDLVPLLYKELRRLAQSMMRHERAGHTLGATALVHEAYVKLIESSGIDPAGQTHFMALAARAMRQLLVDSARKHKAARRGGGWEQRPLEEIFEVLRIEPVDGSEIGDALENLGAVDERALRVIELRFFGGLTNLAIADYLGISESTVEADWRAGRAWLRRELVR